MQVSLDRLGSARCCRTFVSQIEASDSTHLSLFSIVCTFAPLPTVRRKSRREMSRVQSRLLTTLGASTSPTRTTPVSAALRLAA